MGSAFHFAMVLIPWMLITMAYCAVGGVTYAKTKNYLKRYTDMDSDDRGSLAIGAGAVWFVAIPWFVVAQLTGNIDPVIREEKQALVTEQRLQRERREAELRAAAERAKALEEIALRARQRLNGEDIPYTEEERAAIETQQYADRRAIEARVVNRGY